MISEEEFIGNRKVVRYLNKALAKGCISHAYIFEGPEHVGKTTLALHFASELLGETFEKVLKNPDLIFITSEKDESQIGVDAIRDLQKNLSLYPFKSKYKVAIIENAEQMNRTAANSLLKTLEEPGKTSVLILISSNLDKILDTIKSRCQIFNLNTVGKHSMEKILSSSGTKQLPGDIIALSEGKPGMAVLLSENEDFFRDIESARSKVMNFFSYNNFQKMDEAARIGLLDKKNTAQILDIWISTLRHEMILSLKTGKDKRAGVMKAAIEKIISVKEDIINNNVNMKLAIENLCLSF
jgi:DNA polymerase-3 subunit delta'